MDELVLTPPVHSPAEPAAGAFLLAAGLAGAGRDVALLDLSLAFFWRELRRGEGRVGEAALRYLLDARSGYEPDRHRSAVGQLHRRLRPFGERHPGWRLTLMDLEPPVRVHDPAAVARWLAENPSPFSELWEESLRPVLEAERPRRVLVSLAYLSQLPAAIDLVRFLDRNGARYAVGGSLPRSLAATGAGLDALRAAIGPVDLGDGSALLGGDARRPLLDTLAWPRMLAKDPYLSARPIVPLALSSGCYWRRCRFCPDRALPYRGVPAASLERFFGSVPASVFAARPVVHLVDSAIPPGPLRRFLPLAKAAGAAFYGFARPTRQLLRGSLVDAAADAGCLMLQLGVESGSGALLGRFDKGVDPAEAERVIAAVAGAGIRTYLYLLFGLPGETDADREATLELLARNHRHVDFLNLSLFNLPSSCELTERAEEHGISLGEFPIEDAALRLYRPFTCGGRSPRDEARAFLKERVLWHPAIREAVLRTPRWLRAAHLALMRLPGRRSP
ncbi:MAG: radical SAM protein [Proteobacteria bacterium]|jgi:hypothetical protein|nr:radical SAM protein [Pseudomonadota bacterium]